MVCVCVCDSKLSDLTERGDTGQGSGYLRTQVFVRFLEKRAMQKRNQKSSQGSLDASPRI